MSTLHQQVSEFHIAMDMPNGEERDGVVRPHLLSQERMKLRLRLIAEEFCELMAAAGVDIGPTVEDAMKDFDDMIRHQKLAVNLTELVDACADLDYVVEGMRLEMGVDGKPIADLVHSCNMAKAGGGKSPAGKQLKPAGWTPPDITGELRRQGWRG